MTPLFRGFLGLRPSGFRRAAPWASVARPPPSCVATASSRAARESHDLRSRDRRLPSRSRRTHAARESTGTLYGVVASSALLIATPCTAAASCTIAWNQSLVPLGIPPGQASHGSCTDPSALVIRLTGTVTGTVTSVPPLNGDGALDSD